MSIGGLISQLSSANLRADPFIDVMNNTLEFPRVRGFCRAVSFRGLRLVTESAIVDVDEHFLRYRTGTAPGSSGSPVFDNWNLLAMHHASTSVQGE